MQISLVTSLAHYSLSYRLLKTN